MVSSFGRMSRLAVVMVSEVVATSLSDEMASKASWSTQAPSRRRQDCLGEVLFVLVHVHHPIPHSETGNHWPIDGLRRVRTRTYNSSRLQGGPLSPLTAVCTSRSLVAVIVGIAGTFLSLV